MPRHPTSLALVVTLLCATLFAACGGDDSRSLPSVPPPAGLAQGDHAVPDVVESYDHDSSSFTQGLLLADDGTLYESAGQYGESDVRVVDLETGDVERRTEVPDDLFAEGLALVEDRLIQLTWREGVARVYDADTLEFVDEYSYTGEGWGLCYDGDRLVMSDGGANLTFRDPDSFDVLGTVAVVSGGQPVTHLNELECVDGRVWANVWPTDLLVEIDPTSGEVLTSFDASNLREDLDDSGADVLNGIAYDPASETFLLTGKLWPTLYRVRLASSAD